MILTVLPFNTIDSVSSFELVNSGYGLVNSDYGLVNIIKECIQHLKNQQIIVMLAVGGAGSNFNKLNISSIVSLVEDLGVDGCDIDCGPG